MRIADTHAAHRGGSATQCNRRRHRPRARSCSTWASAAAGAGRRRQASARVRGAARTTMASSFGSRCSRTATSPSARATTKRRFLKKSTRSSSFASRWSTSRSISSTVTAAMPPGRSRVGASRQLRTQGRRRGPIQRPWRLCSGLFSREEGWRIGTTVDTVDGGSLLFRLCCAQLCCRPVWSEREHSLIFILCHALATTCHPTPAPQSAWFVHRRHRLF